MPALIERLRTVRSGHGRRLLRYAAVSVVSTVVTQGVLFITYDVVSLASAVVCNVVATAVATVPAYWLNRTWTWGKRGKSSAWREIAPFWVISFVGLVLSTLSVGLAAHNADSISSSHVVQRGFVQFANLFTYGLIWVARYLVFNRFLFGQQTRTVPDEVPGEVEAIVVEEHLAAERTGASSPGESGVTAASR